MTGGNFGHHDTRIKKISKGKIQFLFINIQHNWTSPLTIHQSSSGGQSGWVITGFGKDSQGIDYMSNFCHVFRENRQKIRLKLSEKDIKLKF